jgi:hypothetical protein
MSKTLSSAVYVKVPYEQPRVSRHKATVHPPIGSGEHLHLLLLDGPN